MHKASQFRRRAMTCNKHLNFTFQAIAPFNFFHSSAFPTDVIQVNHVFLVLRKSNLEKKYYKQTCLKNTVKAKKNQGT